MTTFSFITLLIFTSILSPAEIKETDTTAVNFIVAENLFKAIHNIDIVSLNVLLAEGADVDTTDSEGNTPLMLASKIGNPRIIKIILAHQPDVNLKNNRGKSALMIASRHGQRYIADQLVRHGADVRARDSDNLTAAQIAIRNGHPQVADFLENRSNSDLTK